jgi:hypothetical protein
MKLRVTKRREEKSGAISPGAAVNPDCTVEDAIIPYGLQTFIAPSRRHARVIVMVEGSADG